MCGGIDTGYDNEYIYELEKLKEEQKKAIKENKYIIISTQKQKIDLSQI